VRLPRDWSGLDLAKALVRLGYAIDHQTGSHLRLTKRSDVGEQHLTIPAHDPLKVGTLNGILKTVCEHTKLTRDALLGELLK
jgi:predicted RNA binding protein YcfA (HicA-like mRNA interferase family)